MLNLSYKDGSLEARFSLIETEHELRSHKVWTDTVLMVSDSSSDDEDTIRTQFAPLGTQSRKAFLQAVNPREVCTIRHPQTGVLAGLWEVDLVYDTEFNVVQSETNPRQVDPDNPVSTRPWRRIRCTREEEVLERDAVNGNPIQTVNKERIIITHPVSIINMDITRYEDYPDDYAGYLDYLEAIVDCTNGQNFYGRSPGYAYMADVNPEEVIITDTQYRRKMYLRTTYTIQFKKLSTATNDNIPGTPFQAKILHEGFIVNTGSSTEPKIEVYLDPKTKQPTRTSLDKDGKKLAEEAEDYYLLFSKHQIANFPPGLEF